MYCGLFDWKSLRWFSWTNQTDGLEYVLPFACYDFASSQSNFDRAYQHCLPQVTGKDFTIEPTVGGLALYFPGTTQTCSDEGRGKPESPIALYFTRLRGPRLPPPLGERLLGSAANATLFRLLLWQWVEVRTLLLKFRSRAHRISQPATQDC